jgi:uncharacterized protein YbaR (Trm112 family)
MEPDLLEILCCPETRQDLALADPDRVAALNRAIERGEAVDSKGRRVDSPVAELLVRRDGTRGYAVREGIPVLLADEAIVLDSVR